MGHGSGSLLALPFKAEKALLLALLSWRYEMALKAVDCDIDLFISKKENGYRLDVEELHHKTLEQQANALIILPLSRLFNNKSTSEATTATTFLFC